MDGSKGRGDDRQVHGLLAAGPWCCPGRIRVPKPLDDGVYLVSREDAIDLTGYLRLEECRECGKPELFFPTRLGPRGEFLAWRGFTTSHDPDAHA